MTLKNYILTHTKCKDFAALKTKLFKIRKNSYGCYYSEIKCKAFKAFYTSNDNHFCEYAFMFYGIGMCNTLAMDKESINKAGIERGAASHYITDKQLQIEIN